MAAAFGMSRALLEGTHACIKSLTQPTNEISIAVTRNAYETGLSALLSSAKSLNILSSVKRQEYEDALLHEIKTINMDHYPECDHVEIACNLQLLTVCLIFADMDLYTLLWRRQLHQHLVDPTTLASPPFDVPDADLELEAPDTELHAALQHAQTRLLIRDSPSDESTIRHLREGIVRVQARITSNSLSNAAANMAAAVASVTSNVQQPPEYQLLKQWVPSPQAPLAVKIPSVPSSSSSSSSSSGSPSPSQAPNPNYSIWGPPSPESKVPKTPKVNQTTKQLPKSSNQTYPLPTGPAAKDYPFICDICPNHKGITSVVAHLRRHFRETHGLSHADAMTRANILYPK